MRLVCIDYLEASRARVQTARILYQAERYAAAIYFAGVGVECLLRAYITRENPQFDERHDLKDMFKQSQISEFVGEKHIMEVSEWLGDIWMRWKNNYRYADDDRLRKEFRKLQYQRRIKGDLLKENARIAVSAAVELQAIGERRWISNES